MIIDFNNTIHYFKAISKCDICNNDLSFGKYANSSIDCTNCKNTYRLTFNGNHKLSSIRITINKDAYIVVSDCYFGFLFYESKKKGIKINFKPNMTIEDVINVSTKYLLLL